MSKRNLCLLAAASALTVTLSACGGGGEGTGVETIPPPPPPPPLTPEQVVIFPNPTPQTFASAGVAATETGSGATMGFTGLSSADADQVHIRYSSSGYYEIQMPGANWEQLGFAKGIIPADPAFANDFQPVSAPQNGASLITNVSRTEGYNYSEMATWFGGSGKFGEVAFGAATPAGQVPEAGSATYQGLVSGTTDVVGFDSFDGNFREPVKGSVDLNFDFGKGTLDGSMSLAFSNGSIGSTPIGTFNFTDTVFASGSTTYSGRFDTTASGDNFFLGRFTGPNAEETIGAWALPFVFNSGTFNLPADHQTHQAFGAWIAKKP